MDLPTTMPSTLTGLASSMCESVRFAAGMTIVGGVFVVAQTLLLVDDAVSGWGTPLRRRA